MKTLVLVRHAKSSWKNPRLDDHHRPLNKRGKKAAPEMARRMKKRGLRPDAIVSSDARRAMDRATAMTAVLGLPVAVIQPASDLYGASSEKIVAVIRRFPDDWQQVMVVGHNPGFTELANLFYPDRITNVPTAGVVELTFDVASWRDIHRHNLASSHYDYPKRKPSG